MLGKQAKQYPFYMSDALGESEADTDDQANLKLFGGVSIPQLASDTLNTGTPSA